jgi:mono/diheme cytochrome c family protein
LYDLSRFIDQKGYEDQANPYKTHPKVDTLAVGMNSAHPMKEYGCTSCHQGEGHRVNDFTTVTHTPQNAKQRKEWEDKYHWHEPHKVPQPMFRLQDTEAACIKCHKGEVRIPMAKMANKGRKLIETYGCNGCHKIDGIAGWKELPKPGPSLEKISAKVSKEFIKNWVWSPHAFNPKAKMPAFFQQSNNSRPDFMKKNMAEVNAIAEYLYDKSKKYKPFLSYTGGNKNRGKKLIQEVGCIGCHSVEGLDEPYSNVGAMKGTYLTGTGSKVDPDWLVSWLKKPSHYDKTTVMPSFRLSNRDANDITAYLMSLKNKKFAKLEFEPLNKEVRDDLLVGYFSQFEPVAFAKAKLEKMTDKERTLELGHRSIGKYGCYSCHNIDGFDPNRAPIGPELTKLGSKPIHQFGFGHEHDIGHTREAWITAHLDNPRRWDHGVPKVFKDLNRMPNFYFKKDEIDAMTTYLLGLVGDRVPLKGQRTLDKHLAYAEEGKAIVNKYNCQGCHKIDDWGGDITVAYEDDLNQGPPYLIGQGHRVQTDWFYNFLQNVHPIRTYVKVRMPSFNFTNDELNKIIAYFQNASKQGIFENNATKVSWLPGEKAAAKKIWNELACTSCHTIGFTKEEAQAPDLHYVKRRLRPSWIKKWLTNPTAIHDYTVMPNFWEGGTESAVDGVLGDDPQRQIQAIMKYILELSQDRKFPKAWPKNGQ